jgi:ubiquinol-cytochrome c reductase cytochrome c subunit
MCVTTKAKRRRVIVPAVLSMLVAVSNHTAHAQPDDLPTAPSHISAQAGLPPKDAQPPSSSAKGAAIFAQRCATCHGTTGEGLSGVVGIAGPSLKAEHDHGRVMTAVEFGPSHMPTFSYVLSVPEIRSVADFVTTRIATIPLQGGDLSSGGDLFRMYCSSCHRTAVRGGAMAFTGVNAPQLTGKSPELIAGAIRWGPGPMPAFPPAVLDDHQLASVVKYVVYVQHPPDPGGNPLRYYGPVSEGMAAFAVIAGLGVAVMWIEKGGQG